MIEAAVASVALVGERLVRVGGTVTVNDAPLLASPPTVTTTLPVVAPEIGRASSREREQISVVAASLKKNTVLLPCVAPKFVPVIVTAVATGALVGERLVRV